MSSLKDQLTNKCRHFTGIMNTCCNVGVDYADVRVGKPYQFPCLKQAGDCSKFAQLTSEEVEQEIRNIVAAGSETLSVYVKVREHFTATKEHAGKLPCECGGVLHYSVAKGNGHIWAKCDTCTVSFME